jgi:eukaryotic-like serine/threonine-protein kinase
MLAPQSDSNPIEALAAEFVARRRRGEDPTVEEYAAQHPELAEQIHELFPTIVALERVRAGQDSLPGGSPAARPAQLKRLGDFHLTREIGRGGMGIVYEAVQESLGRRVAVKVLARHSRLDDTHRRRFLREARTAGRLHHTNIVPILGVGEQDGLDYLVMQYIDGVGLDFVISRMRNASIANPASVRLSAFWDPNRFAARSAPATRAALTSRESSRDTAQPGGDAIPDFAHTSTDEALRRTPGSTADARLTPTSESGSPIGGTQPLRQVCHSYWQDVAFVGLQVAQALEYAHSQGTLHRDIKPGNLLIDAQGTTWVADFGLAKAMDQDAVSRTGEVLGTLLYMAPEQWRGTTDARSDIYSLGVTLYELATLRVPLEVHDRMHPLGRANVAAKITPPRKICPSLPVDLETIIMRAMADEPAHRYQTTGELSLDLARFLQDQPISVRRPSLWERWWRWRRRNPAAAYFSTAAAALLILVVGVTSVAYVQTRVALNRASQASLDKDQALASEKLERERAELMLTTSLATLDNVFNRLVPDQLDSGRALTISALGQGSQTAMASPESAALLEELLKVYDQFATDPGQQSRLGAEAARANRRVGDIHARLGNLDRAQGAYQQSIEKYQTLAAADSDRRLPLEIARLHNDLGAIYDRQLHHDQSRREYQLALGLLESNPSGTDSAQARFETARTHFLLGRGSDPHIEPDHPHGGPPPHGPHGPPPNDFSLRMPGHRPPPHPEPHDPPPDQDGGGPPSDEEQRSRPRERPDAPPPRKGDLKELGTAIRLLEALIKSDPKNPAYRFLLAQCYREESDPRAASSKELEKAEELLTQLVKEYPGVADYHFALADTYAMSDIRELPPEEVPEAERNLKAALAETTALVDRNPYATDYASLHVHVLHKLATVLRRSPSGHDGAPATIDEIGRLFQDAIRKQAGLVERFPENTAYRFWLAKIRMSSGEFWLERQNPEEARKVFEAAVHEIESSPAGKVTEKSLRDVLQELYERLAETLDDLRQNQAAEVARGKAEKLGPLRRRPDGERFRPGDHRDRPPPPWEEGPEHFGPRRPPGRGPENGPPPPRRHDEPQ